MSYHGGKMIKEKLAEKYMNRLSEIGLAGIDMANIFMLRFKKGEYICSEGQPILYLFILLEGKAQVYVTSKDGKTLLLCYYTSKGILGEVELLSDGVATSSVQAITEVYCIGLPLLHYKDYLTNNIKFMNYLCSELAQKLSRSVRNSTANILYPLETRLCAYISMSGEGNHFYQKLTETAELLGTSYRHLLRVLEKLCAQGILERVPHGYLIKDPSALAKKSSGFENI
jgi:CRP/FNR family putative post-exponential-phase nitrogen-starvation transcriptional regulator